MLGSSQLSPVCLLARRLVTLTEKDIGEKGVPAGDWIEAKGTKIFLMFHKGKVLPKDSKTVLKIVLFLND